MSKQVQSLKGKTLLKREFKKRAKLRWYRRHPLQWMEDVLNIDPKSIRWSLHKEYKNHTWDATNPDLVTPDPLYQALQGLAHGRDVGIEAATGVGKTYSAAAIALWFVDCWRKIKDEETGEIIDPGGLVIGVATREQQLRDVLFKELENFKGLFKNRHPNSEWLDLKMRMDPRDEASSKEGWGVTGMTASVMADEEVSTKFSGIHAPHMLFIVDEAPGVHPAILEAIENTCTANHNLRLFLGNPRSQSDTLHTYCKLEDVKHIRASALDHPNVVLGKEVVPGAVTQRSIDRRMRKYNDPTHRTILSRVHGVSPATSGLSLFPDDLIRNAKDYINRMRTSDEDYPKSQYEVRPPAEGQIRIYDEAKHDKLGRYLMFADVAGDRSEKGDWHACVVFDRIEERPVALLHMRGSRTRYVKYIMKLAEMYTIRYGRTGKMVLDGNGNKVPEKKKYRPLFAYERNNVGGLHMDSRVENYPNLYHKRSTDTPTQESVRASVGWHTNSNTRPDMIDALEEWAYDNVEDGSILMDPQMWHEARVFAWNEDKDKFEAEQGENDDIIMALAGAVTIHNIVRKRFISTEKYAPEPERTPKNIDKFHPPESESHSPLSDNQFANASTSGFGSL